MEATPRFELGIKVLQTTALPLGYVAILARVAGFEPAHDGIRIHCLTTWLYPNNTILIFHSLYLGWVVGFEPTHTGATTLGLNRLTIPTIQCSSFFRATASSVSLRLSHILRYAPSSSLTIPCISKKILRIQHLFSELLRHSFHSCSVTYLSMLLRIHSAFLVSRKKYFAYSVFFPSCCVTAFFPAAARKMFQSFNLENWRPRTGSNRRPPA